MRNNIYCNKFRLEQTHIEDTQTGIHYILESDLKSDTLCHNICDSVKRRTCEILQHFQKLRVPNRNYFIKD